jgi:hypothetical protein
MTVASSWSKPKRALRLHDSKLAMRGLWVSRASVWSTEAILSDERYIEAKLFLVLKAHL